MKKENFYLALEDDFKSTFIRELLPGVLHNFANPLNGIMGRSKLLQRRIDAVVKKMSEQYPETAEALKDNLQRIKNDIRSINKETDSFFHMFRDVSDKFSTLAAPGRERINLSRLLAAEIRFAEFYLEFKHEINKQCEFDGNLPEFQGDAAELSLVFWRLIRHAMTRALESKDGKEFFLQTAHDEEKILVSLRYSGEALPGEQNHAACRNKETGDPSCPGLDQSVLSALDLLKKYPAKLEFSRDNGLNVMSVTFFYSKISG